MVWKRQQRGPDGLKDKDRFYRALIEAKLASRDLTVDDAMRDCIEGAKRTTVTSWLAGANRLWKSGLEDDGKSRVPMETRDLWRNARKQLEAVLARPSSTTNTSSAKRQIDPLLRQEVETAAINETTKCFTSEGYEVDSVEKDNVGWDLEATRGSITLRLEVKGLNGPEICVELTPNEYANMKQHRDSYRVCVVSSARTMPKLAIFSFSKNDGVWVDQDGQRLEIVEKVAARCRVNQS